MKIFESLDKVSNEEMESKILKKWKSEDILNKTIENRKNSKNFVFYDGPIYANAKPGIHHVFAKTIKDSICKYRTMKGNRVLRKIGLDTHGLPIEVNVEKKLGFKSKADIEKFGIENFCKECNKETATNIDIVKKVTDQMGQFIDMENPYITCSNEFIESEWWLIKNIFDQGLIYHGNKVLPYCPRCGTELSANEVSQGYKNVSVNTVIVPFKLKDEDTYVLVWTTTPWTLIDNVALCVNPNYEYLKVESMGYKFIVGKSLAEKVLGDDFKVLEELTGKDLEGLSYEQLLPFAKVEGKAFVILADTYVTDTDGTGIVHIAPAYGEDDSRVAKENGVAFVQSVDKDGKYKIGPWEGTVVTDSDLEIEIIKYLKANDKLFKKIKLTHDYPHCWRCKKPLLNYAKPAWYIQTTARQKEIIEANKKVSWHPAYVGEKRFANWLEGMVDWGISRNRYWGCPMPLWTCDCGNVTCIGSINELKEKSVDNIDIESMELHRPYIDNVHLKCEKCGKEMTRANEVIDCWFDSGSMPFAQLHYPFENKELFEQNYPAQFISEAVDQTRGWFYTLLAISTAIFDRNPFENCIVLGHVLDKKGLKMSKSKGNVVDPFDVLDAQGADATRWHFYTASAPWLPTRFSIDDVGEAGRKFMGTLWNVYSFYVLYAELDQFNPLQYADFVSENVMDKWIMSKLNTLVKDVEAMLDSYQITQAALDIEEFTDELSNWYVRRNRGRYWTQDLTDDKIGAYVTLYKVLTTVIKVAAPFVPFITENIYQNLVVGLDENAPESIHLCRWPEVDEKAIDKDLEKEMDLAYTIVKLGRSARNGANIKNRQPLSNMLVSTDSLPGYYGDIITDELNIKEVEFGADLSTHVNFEIKPNLPVLGKKYGKLIPVIRKEIAARNQMELAQTIQNGEVVVINVDGNEIELNNENLLVTMQGLEGYAFAGEGSIGVVLDTNITDELREEGHVREMISKIQNMRKDKGFEVADKIKLYVADNDMLLTVIKKYAEVIKKETLTQEIVYNTEADYSDTVINGENLKMTVEVVR